MNKDLYRLLELEKEITLAIEMNYDTYKLNQEYEQLKSKLNEKLERYDDYVKDDWIAIPKKDFDVIQKEHKEDLQQIKQLKEELESINKLPKCKHSCDCTDCQMRCITCTVELRESKLNHEIQSLKSQLEKYQQIAKDLQNIIHDKDKTISELSKTGCLDHMKIMELQKVIDDIRKWVKISKSGWEENISFDDIDSILSEAEK